MPVGGHSSLLDELDEVENENELQQTQDSATPAGVKQNQLPLQAHTLPIAGSAAAAAPSNPSAVGAEAAIPAHTPLAKYLQRLAGAPEEAEEAEEETVTDADAPLGAEAEDGANDAAVPSVPASASAAATPAADATSTHASLLSSLLLEVAAPALAAAAAPPRTLSHRSKRWCVRLCVDAAHTADSGDRSDARLQPQLDQLSAQLGQIRLLHLAALALATLQLLCCGAQLLLAFAQHLGLFVLLPLLLGSSASIAVPAPVGTQWLPSVYLVLCAVALLNAAAAYSSLRACIHWHSFCASFLRSIAGLGESERGSKRLILALMEREIVRRGYHLAHFLPPIERMEAQQQQQQQSQQRPAGTSALSASAAAAAAAAVQDSSTHIRALLQRSFQSETALAQQLGQLFVEMSAHLDSFAPLDVPRLDASAMAEPAAATDAATAAAASAALPSIVHLKSARTRCLHERQRMLSHLLALLRRLEAWDAPMSLRSVFTWPTEENCLPALLARCALRLAVQLAQHNAAMQTLLPAPPISSPPSSRAAAPGEEEAHGAASSVAAAAATAFSDPVRDSPLDLTALPLSAARRSLQQSLRDVHNTVRSAERRVQIALERQLPPLPPPAMEQPSLAHAAVPTPADKEQCGWFRQLEAHFSFPPAPAPALSVSYSSGAAPVAEWSAPLSASLAHDALFVRHALMQLGRQCDALEALVRRVDAEEGLSDSLEQQQQAERDGPELAMVSQHQPTGSNEDASVSQADLMEAMLAMRKKTPSGMGALFEGSGEFQEKPFVPRRAPPRPAAGAAGAPAAPAVSIFTILSELKCVLQQRTPAYEYFSHAPTSEASQQDC